MGNIGYDRDLAKPDPDRMYGGEAHGYIDYPTLEKVGDKVREQRLTCVLITSEGWACHIKDTPLFS